LEIRKILRPNPPSSGLRIIWLECIILDLSLSKTTELEILNSLSKLNHTVELIALRSRTRIESKSIRLTLIPLRKVSLVTPILFTLVTALLMPFRIAFSGVDVIITEPGANFLAIIPSLLFAKLKKTKIVLDVRSPPVEAYGLPGLIEKNCFSLSILFSKKFFDGMTIITPRMRDEICQKYNIDKSFVGTWSSGVSTSVFDANKYVLKKNKLKEKLNLSNKFVIIYHGYFAQDRGLKETIDAMDLLKNSYPDIVLFLLGNGLFESSLKSLAEAKKLNNVIIHEPVEYFEVPKFIAMSDSGVIPLPDLPHWRSQCPLKLLEYLAMEKPIILSDIPAHRVIINSEKCGIYLGSIEPQEIARAIVYAYRNKENLEKWGKKGKEIVNNKYTWEKVANDLEAYLMKIVKDRTEVSKCQLN
jgi:glycosyltransferase involved in cell wall biosynthesis